MRYGERTNLDLLAAESSKGDISDLVLRLRSQQVFKERSCQIGAE